MLKWKHRLCPHVHLNSESSPTKSTRLFGADHARSKRSQSCNRVLQSIRQLPAKGGQSGFGVKLGRCIVVVLPLPASPRPGFAAGQWVCHSIQRLHLEADGEDAYNDLGGIPAAANPEALGRDPRSGCSRCCHGHPCTDQPANTWRLDFFVSHAGQACCE